MTETLQPPARQTTADTPVFAVQGLWKVFGPRPERIPADPELAALPPAELRERTGCTAAFGDECYAGPTS
jgi:glycine betaine/proline transport system ATP-binding protein